MFKLIQEYGVLGVDRLLHMIPIPWAHPMAVLHNNEIPIILHNSTVCTPLFL